MIPSSSAASIPVRARACSSTSRAARHLLSVATIGSIALTGYSAATRRIARELGGEYVRALERQADPADAEEGVVLRRHRQGRQRLVGARVERAHDQRPPVERDRDPPQGLGLLVLVGELGRAQEQELGAQQADALGAQLDRAGGLAGAAEVGEHLDPGAVPCDAPARPRAPPRAAAPPPRSLAPLPASRSKASRGIDRHGPGIAVEQQSRPVSDAEHAGPEPDDRRQSQRPGQDRGVGGGRAARGGDRQHPLRVKTGGIGGRQLVGDHDAGDEPAAPVVAGPVRAATTRRPTSSTSTARSLQQRLGQSAVAARPPATAASYQARSAVAPGRSPSARAPAARRRRAAPDARRRSRPRPAGAPGDDIRSRSIASPRRRQRVMQQLALVGGIRGGSIRRRHRLGGTGRWAGPIATPAEAGTPMSTAPGCGGS